MLAIRPLSPCTGFTLIELSIVLVIIGLIVGGVLVGQDLINASHVLAQVAQITKYNTAVNTFQLKYGYLPGDIPASEVAPLGFTAAPVRAGIAGRGDGNGLIEGYDWTSPAFTAGLSSGEGHSSGKIFRRIAA
jgi:prepilin-type N-terminal cleavage/methylation domain-containing protein